MTTYPSTEETLYRLNGTFLAEGDAGKTLAQIASHLEHINWNLGTMNKTLTFLSEIAYNLKQR